MLLRSDLTRLRTEDEERLEYDPPQSHALLSSPSDLAVDSEKVTIVLTTESLSSDGSTNNRTVTTTTTLCKCASITTPEQQRPTPSADTRDALGFTALDYAGK